MNLTAKFEDGNDSTCICLYSDKDGITHIVIGEDLSKEAHYYRWVTVDSDGNEVYDFVEVIKLKMVKSYRKSMNTLRFQVLPRMMPKRYL